MNVKRITKDEETPLAEFKLDEDKRDIKDNLLIKGNNLLALHSLKKRFAGKVKLIYIDPPYNTGSDSFGYNDSFNHSTWLTFMKNRLEVARELLAENANIVIQCDWNESHYIKILLDEIFGRDNFLNEIIWNSTKSVTNTAIVSVAHTHTLVYFKQIRYAIENRTEFRLPENGEGFSNPDNDPRGVWKADPFQVGGWRPNQQYEIINPNTNVIYTPNEGCSWKNDYNKFQELLKDNRIVFGVDGKSAPQRKRFLTEALERGKVATTIWNDVGTTTNGTQHLKQLFGKSIFSNPKPEAVIERIITLATKENDIVLDFFAGSGTTAAVAHKMNRQWITIEQMDYIEDITKARLKKVLEGEQGGISKSVQWTGGGDFVYMELAPFNELYKQAVLNCNNADELMTVYETMKEKAFLDYRYDLRKELKGDKEFVDLSFEEQKAILIELLDKNQMYIPYTEIEDKSYGLNDSDITASKKFYEDGK